MTHVCRWWYDERFLARPYGVACSCGWPCSGGGCFPDQASAEEAIDHHKQRWAEAEARLAEIAAVAHTTASGGTFGLSEARPMGTDIPLGTRQKEE